MYLYIIKQKQIKMKKGKYVLLCGVGYLSNTQSLNGVKTTHNINQAQIFDYEVDNPNQKIDTWNQSIKNDKQNIMFIDFPLQ